MRKLQLRAEDIDFLLDNERSLLDSIIVFKAAILSSDNKAERMRYIRMYQKAYGNTKREKAITQRVFNHIVGGNYSIKQISYIATAVRELIMCGEYQKDVVPIETKEKIAASQEYCCAICGETFEMKTLEIDHKIPQSVIGTHFGEANLQVLCHKCNSSRVKGTTIGLQSRFATAMRNTH